MSPSLSSRELKERVPETKGPSSLSSTEDTSSPGLRDETKLCPFISFMFRAHNLILFKVYFYVDHFFFNVDHFLVLIEFATILILFCI